MESAPFEAQTHASVKCPHLGGLGACSPEPVICDEDWGSEKAERPQVAKSKTKQAKLQSGFLAPPPRALAVGDIVSSPKKGVQTGPGKPMEEADENFRWVQVAKAVFEIERSSGAVWEASFSLPASSSRVAS